MVPWLMSLAVLPRDSGSILSTYMVNQNTCNSIFWGPGTLSLVSAKHASGTQINMFTKHPCT